ncbi:hypothetical protein Tco_0778693 [Tanacetum coccineum]
MLAMLSSVATFSIEMFLLDIVPKEIVTYLRLNERASKSVVDYKKMVIQDLGVQRIENKVKTVTDMSVLVKSKPELKEHFTSLSKHICPEVTPFVESEEWLETNNELYKMMEDFMERMNQELHNQEVLLAAQGEQELLVQKEAAQEKQVSSPNSVFHQLIEETCGIKVCEEQKQNMEDTMLDLLEICRQKELYCIHNNVKDLIESALNSKLLLINLNSQRLNKEE